ncbi:autophagy-related 2 isoform X1 [Rhynchophorus ferrugineus]|uniref:autophagy-related 2 isoform X1 n=1 Tax=Rhynchophorus ferrugineus TaxID=354439 RepID=UPI003FCD8D63
MSWYRNIIPEWVKKSVCSCLIKRYLSGYIENEVTKDQLNLDLYNGRATAERIGLAVQSLNELSDAQNWPFEFVAGYIDKIHISVPWTSIRSNSTQVEICGLKVTIQPKQRKEDATSMFESMWNSMTSSMHLAEEIANTECRDNRAAQGIEAIEKFAQVIESIVRRIKVRFVDTVIQIEHLPKQSTKGVGLLINIDCMNYCDEASFEDPTMENTFDPNIDDSRKAYLFDSFTVKNLVIEGIKLSTIEFASVERTTSRSFTVSTSGASSKHEDSASENDESERIESSDGSEAEDEPSPDRHIICFAKFSSRQEVKVKLKQSENTNGPKVAIDVNLGSVVLFMSPRQFHILMELVNGFCSPDLEDHSNIPNRNPYQPRPMTQKDYDRVEEQLIQMTTPMNQYQPFNMQTAHGWSGDLDDSSDDQYVFMGNCSNTMYGSAVSDSNSMDSSMTSSIGSFATDNTNQSRRRVSNLDVDPTAEISRFHVRLASLSAILLHEEFMTAHGSNEKVLVKQIQNTADEFFNSINTNSFVGLSHDSFEEVHKLFDQSCKLNHLRLLAYPLHIEADEKTTSSAFSISGHLTANKLELIECLHNTGEAKHIAIASFCSSDGAALPSSVKPNVKLKFKHTERTNSTISRKYNGPKTDISISLDKCSGEFDLSIIDRIVGLLHCPPICDPVKPERNVWTNKQYMSKNNLESTFDLKVNSSMLNLKLRFPIPDFRPAHDMSKVPWWERNVRPDYLSLVLKDANFHTVFVTNQTTNEYSLECRLLDIYYYETENSAGLHIARSGKEDKYMSSLEQHIPPTKLSIKIYPKCNNIEDDFITDPMTQSLYGAFENQGNIEPGPFGSKKIVHESDIPHNKQSKDTEVLVIPGDKDELDEFEKSTTASTEILVELNMPIVSLQLHSKRIYELIYNRINNDLLLWTSSAPKPAVSDPYKTAYSANFNDFDSDDNYIMAKSGVQLDSDSESSDDSDTFGTNVFHSTYETKSKHSSRANTTLPKRTSQSEFVLSLQITEGLLSLNPPVRDAASNVIPGQQGELLMKLTNARVFVVSGYKGDSDLGYVCAQISDAHLYHCDMQPTPSTASPLKEVDSTVGKYLFSTLYQSDSKILASSRNKRSDREMFSVAIKIQANHETHHVKAITVSLGLNKATLRHRMSKDSDMWILQLIDFFNVQDYPIPGYIAKDVLTELHFNLWDCAIDYRPFHLPLRSVITIGNFSLCSHLTAVSNTSTLLLLFEDCGLFLSDKAPPKNGVPSIAPVDLVKDYVNIVELALFEISIKTTDKKSGINPHIDLRASNNMLHIRTCSDSGRALLQLLNYYINNGDLNPEPSATDSETHADVTPKTDEGLVTVDQYENVLSQSQQDQLTEMLEEAMRESPKESKTKTGYPLTGAKLFYFPDEKETLEELPTSTLPQVSTDLGELYNFGRCGDSDDDFCILENDAISDLFPKDGVPEVAWLANDTLNVIEHYISAPVGKRDVLEPPRDFPKPVMRYTLCEMSVIWQMFGGRDFRVPDSSKKEVRFDEKHFSEKVRFSSSTSKVTFDQKEKTGYSWIARGGPDRDQKVLMELQLNKVRFRHELYPENTKEASRQVLSIADVEIRDRLESSQINKFLYQYYSQAKPKKSHSNMVLIKALHIRPDAKLKTQECMLKIALLPIRLNIDQDALLFLMNFFKEIGGDTSDSDIVVIEKEGSSQGGSSHQAPIMSMSISDEKDMTQKAKQVVNDNLILLESRYNVDPEENLDSSSTTSTDDSPVYFRYVEFARDVLIRLDYHGKRLDMTHGPIAGLLMGLGQLKYSEIRLKRIVYRHGLLGFNKLVSYLFKEWLNDIKKNQLSNILSGLGPMYAVMQLLQGLRDLFWLPIEQYQKDGRIVRGLQRGANSFTTSTALAALELTSRIIYYIQVTAETAYDMLSPGPSIRLKKKLKHKGRKKRHHQPQDIREGLTNACIVVKDGLVETADNIVQMATQEKEQKGISGAMGAVLRQLPAAVIKPIVIATEATNNVLGGVQSQLVPDARTEANQKWRSN